MATYALDSVGGSDSNTGVAASSSDFTKAWATLAHALAGMLAGDTLYIGSDHSESLSIATTYTVPGTLASPCILVSVNKSTGVYAAGASWTNSVGGAATAFTFDGTFVAAGLSLTRSGAAHMALMNASPCRQLWIDPSFLMSNATISRNMFIGANTAATRYCELRNPTFSFAADPQGIILIATGLRILGGSIAGASTAQAGGFIYKDDSGQSSFGNIDIIGFDFTNLGSTGNIVNASGCQGGGGVIRVRGATTPASWTGTLVTGSVPVGWRIDMQRSDNAAHIYERDIEAYEGSVVQDTAHYLNATDGTTHFSRKMTTNSGASYPVNALRGEEMYFWNDSTTVTTATVEICQEGGSNLNNNDVWLEVESMQSASTPIVSVLNDGPASLVTAAAAQTTSTASWTGFTTPTKQKLQVTIAPALKGPMVARVYLAKASTTIYVDPEVTVA
jgi:hypothetical protein